MTGLETLGAIALAASTALSGVQSKDAMLNFKHAAIGASISTAVAPVRTVLTGMTAVASPVRTGDTSFASVHNCTSVTSALRVEPRQSISRHLTNKGSSNPFAANRLPYLSGHLAFQARGGQLLPAKLPDPGKVHLAFASTGPQASLSGARTRISAAFPLFPHSLAVARLPLHSFSFSVSQVLHCAAGSGTIHGVWSLTPDCEVGPWDTASETAVPISQESALALSPHRILPGVPNGADLGTTTLFISPVAFACPHNS